MKKIIFSFAAVVIAAFAVVGCDSSSSSSSVTLKIESEDGHNFVFTATPTGDYDGIQWEISGGSGENGATVVEQYYAKVGTYSVKVSLWKSGSVVATASDSAVVTELDPNYDYTLVWSDEFDGTELNYDDWGFDLGYIANNELQDYQGSGNHEVSDGTLKIYAIKVNDNKEFGSYTSARIKTQGKQEFTYGKMEARLKLPTGKGVWPAFWMLGSNISTASWPGCGEIDIMEFVGYEPTTIYGSIHTTDNNHSIGTGLGGNTQVADVSEWHTYGLIWDTNGLKFYVDDPDSPYFTWDAPSVKTDDSWPFDAPLFFILNLAIGGDWGGAQGIDNTIFDEPVVYEVDYVKVYQYL